MRALKKIILTLILPLLFISPAFADEREQLFEQLKSAKSETSARMIEKKIWQHWLKGPDQKVSQMVATAMKKRQSYDYAGALEILNEAVKLAPTWAEAWNQRAFIHFLREEYDKSLHDCNQAIKLEPKHFGALSGKARILMVQGRVNLGQKILREAVEIYPFIQDRALLIKVPGQKI